MQYWQILLHRRRYNHHGGGEHRPDWVTTYPFSGLPQIFEWARGIIGHPKSKGPTIIGNDVWIGQFSLILSGVTVGDGAVIGAKAVVTKDVPPYAIVAGNPARLIRYRFSQEQIKQLLEIKWWNWDLATIQKFVKELCSPDIDKFISLAKTYNEVNLS